MNFTVLFSFLVLFTVQNFFASSLPAGSESAFDRVPRRRSAGNSIVSTSPNHLFHDWPGQSGKVYPTAEVVVTCACQQIAQPRSQAK